MKTKLQSPEVISVAAPTGGTTVGVGVLINALFGIADSTEAAGETVQLVTTGVFTVAKTSAQAWAVGAAVYWDNTNKVFTTTASGNTLVGQAVQAAVNPSSTGVVRLNG